MNDIHSTALIYGEVEFGSGNTVGPFVVIHGPASIGDDNWIGTGVVIGAPPEVRGAKLSSGPDDVAKTPAVRIGDRNVIREYAQIHAGWKGATTVGNDAYIMNQVYIAHDCVVGDRVTLASSVLLAGHTQVDDDANLGLGTAVHQRRFVGAGSMIGMSSVVTRDVPPFSKAYGSPAKVVGVNAVGMRRSGIPEESVAALTDLYEADPVDPDFDSIAGAPAVAGAAARWAGRHDDE